MGCSLYSVIGPLTRGSTMTACSSIAPMARVTASMSALTKFTVTALDVRPPLRALVLRRAGVVDAAAGAAAAGAGAAVLVFAPLGATGAVWPTATGMHTKFTAAHVKLTAKAAVLDVLFWTMLTQSR